MYKGQMIGSVWVKINEATMQQIAPAFIATMLAAKLPQFCLVPVCFLGVTVRYYFKIHDASDLVKCFPQLPTHEF
jgi:hypothetical protein